MFYPRAGLHVLAFQLDGEGASALLHSHPALDAQVCGRECSLQAAVLDASAAGGVSLTAGLYVEFGAAGSAPSGYSVSSGVSHSAGSSPQSTTVADLNGDAIPDVVVANRVAGSLSVLLGSWWRARGTMAAGRTLEGVRPASCSQSLRDASA